MNCFTEINECFKERREKEKLKSKSKLHVIHIRTYVRNVEEHRVLNSQSKIHGIK